LELFFWEEFRKVLKSREERSLGSYMLSFEGNQNQNG
jgi:hypothetical protein